MPAFSNCNVFLPVVVLDLLEGPARISGGQGADGTFDQAINSVVLHAGLDPACEATTPLARIFTPVQNKPQTPSSSSASCSSLRDKKLRKYLPKDLARAPYRILRVPALHLRHFLAPSFGRSSSSVWHDLLTSLISTSSLFSQKQDSPPRTTPPLLHASRPPASASASPSLSRSSSALPYSPAPSPQRSRTRSTASGTGQSALSPPPSSAEGTTASARG